LISTILITIGLFLTLMVQQASAFDSESSWPPDTSPHARSLVPDDWRLDQGAEALSSGIFMIDVNDIDFADGSEPSIAIDAVRHRHIVVHGGFGGWNSNAPIYESLDGGHTWSREVTVPPPPGAADTGSCPCDTTIDFEPGILAGAFLTGATDIFTGTTANPAEDFNYLLVSGDAQMTNLAGVDNADQPWLLTNRDPKKRRHHNIYVGYDDFSTSPVGERIAVALGTDGNPPDFTIDNQSGAGGGGINPGHRLVVDRRNGFVYSLWETCVANCAGDPKTIQFMLNRSRDAGAHWTLNNQPGGIAVATADSTQPTPKFGTVNALLGGIDHAAVNPNTGNLFYVYGSIVSGNQQLAIRKIKFSQGMAIVGDEHFVTDGSVDAALPSIAVAANGTIGVLYDTFDGFSTSVGTCRGHTGRLPIFTAHFARSTNGGVSFKNKSLLSFLSPCPDDQDPRQRVLGDYQQLKAVGATFYGVFTGNGAALGRSSASSDPIFFKLSSSE
jgi:hypothetical protein